MKIGKAEYEELLRDSERLRIIEVLVDANCVADVNDAVMLICGYAPKEKVATAEKTFAECIIPDNAESEIDSSCAKKALPKRNKIDRGKVSALHRAGWSNVKIAEEMRCSESSISMILSSKEEKKDAD